MMETERLRLLDTFTDGEGGADHRIRQQTGGMACAMLKPAAFGFCVFCRNYLDFLLSP